MLNHLGREPNETRRIKLQQTVPYKMINGMIDIHPQITWLQLDPGQENHTPTNSYIILHPPIVSRTASFLELYQDGTDYHQRPLRLTHWHTSGGSWLTYPSNVDFRPAMNVHPNNECRAVSSGMMPLRYPREGGLIIFRWAKSGWNQLSITSFFFLTAFSLPKDGWLILLSFLLFFILPSAPS